MAILPVLPVTQCLGKDGQTFAMQMGDQAQKEMDRLLAQDKNLSLMRQQKEEPSGKASHLPKDIKEQLGAIQFEAAQVIDKGGLGTLGSKRGCASSLFNKEGKKKCALKPGLNPLASQSLKELEEGKEKQMLVFVSFSMPEASLKALSREAQRHNALLVMRGLYWDSFSKTAARMKEMAITVDIDPHLFESHKVTAVPTFIKVQDGKPVVRLQGNVTLGFAVEQFRVWEGKHSKLQDGRGRP